MPAPRRRRVKRKAPMKRRRRRTIGSFIRKKKDGSQIMVFKPSRGLSHRNEVMPEILITTVTAESRLNWANAITPQLGGTTQYFNICGDRAYRCLNANNYAGGSGFRTITNATPVVAVTGDTVTNQSAPGHTELASIYSNYVILEHSLEIIVNDFATATDGVTLFVIPVVLVQAGVVFAGNITNAQNIAQQKNSAEQTFQNYINAAGLRKLRTKVNAAEFWGYTSAKALMDDDGMWNPTNNTNVIPYNSWCWEVAAISSIAGNTQGTIVFTVRQRMKIAYKGFVYNQYVP